MPPISYINHTRWAKDSAAFRECGDLFISLQMVEDEARQDKIERSIFKRQEPG